MHLVIISGATRPEPISNTAKIIEAFRLGFEEQGNTTEKYFLSDRKQWAAAFQATEKNENILFAIPLYVENIPGSMLEFLQEVTPKTDGKTRMAFLLQGGFDEACQLRCCEEFLKTLPRKLGCDYAGTLIKGGMFGIRFVNEQMQSKMTEPYIEMGRVFAKKGTFTTQEVRDFAGPEYMTRGSVISFALFGKIFMRLFMTKLLHSQGDKKASLTAKPYAGNLK